MAHEQEVAAQLESLDARLAEHAPGQLALDACARAEGHAEALFDRRARRLLQAQFGDDAEVGRLVAGGSQRALDDGPHARARLLQHERLGRQLVERHDAACVRVARRQRQHDLVGRERLVDQVAVQALVTDDAELELALEHAVDHLARRVDLQRHLDLGIEATEVDEHARQEARAGAGRCADLEPPADRLRLLVGEAVELTLEREHALSARDHEQAVGSRLDLAPRAVDERHPEALLERLDGL